MLYCPRHLFLIIFNKILVIYKCIKLHYTKLIFIKNNVLIMRSLFFLFCFPVDQTKDIANSIYAI